MSRGRRAALIQCKTRLDKWSILDKKSSAVFDGTWAKLPLIYIGPGARADGATSSSREDTRGL
eukprot:10424447-Alexandrium_andersonii.AAC.1